MVVWLYTSTFYSQELGFGSFGTIYQAKHKVRVQSSWLLKHFPKHLTQRNPAHRMIKFGASHWTAWCFSKMCNSSKAVGDQKAFGYDMNIWYEFVLWQLSIFIFQVSYISLSFHFSFHPHGFQPCVASVLGLQICGTLATKFFADLKWFSRRVDFLVVFDKVKKVPKAEDDEKLSLDLQIVCWLMPFSDLQYDLCLRCLVLKHDETGDSDDRILYCGTWISFHVVYRGVMNHELVFAIFVDCFLARSASLMSWTVEEATTTHPCKNKYVHSSYYNIL